MAEIRPKLKKICLTFGGKKERLKEIYTFNFKKAKKKN